MPKNTQSYSCNAIRSDKFTVHVAREEGPHQALLAFVSEDREDNVISVCITRDQAIQLQIQVNQFIHETTR